MTKRHFPSQMSELLLVNFFFVAVKATATCSWKSNISALTADKMYFNSEPLQAAKQHVCLGVFKDCRNVAVGCLSMCRKKMYLNQRSAEVGFKTWC